MGEPVKPASTTSREGQEARRGVAEFAKNFRQRVTVCAGCTWPEVMIGAAECPDCELPTATFEVVPAERAERLEEALRELVGAASAVRAVNPPQVLTRFYAAIRQARAATQENPDDRALRPGTGGAGPMTVTTCPCVGLPVTERPHPDCPRHPDQGQADAVRTFDPEAPARAEKQVRAALSKSWDCPCGEDRNIGPDCRACGESHPYLALHPENRHLAPPTDITLTLSREDVERHIEWFHDNADGIEEADLDDDPLTDYARGEMAAYRSGAAYLEAQLRSTLEGRA